MRHGDSNYFTTVGGRKFWPTDARQEDVNIGDIAISLSHQCRFLGHCFHFYSVAQHSVLVARHVPDEFKQAALLHDAAEAYIGDLPRPLKHDDELTFFRELDDELTALIYKKFHVGFDKLPDEVKRVDTLILQDEVRCISGNVKLRPGYMNGPGLGIPIVGWPPVKARNEFLLEFEHLFGATK